MADKKREKKNIVTVLSREEYLRQRAASDEALTIRLTNNYAFRKIFKNEKVLKGFIMALLNLEEEQIMRLDIVDPCEDGENDAEKEGVLDVKIHMNDNQKINLEMQNRYQEDWSERSVFYNCRMFTEGFIHGAPYGEMEPCIHVGILDFNQMKSSGFHHCIMLRDEETGEVYSSKFVFHMIELKKLKVASGEERKQELYHWAKLIAATSWEEVRMEAKGNPYREAAVNEMDKINQSETERYLYLRREMAISDEKSRLVSAENKGREEGMQQGFEIAKKIFKLYSQGLTEEKIAEEIGITVERVRKIVKD